MAHHNNKHSLSSSLLIFFLSYKLNSYCLIKTFMVILVIYGNISKLKRSFNVAASENFTTALSIFVTPHIDANDDILQINNFDGNFFDKNQIISDILQHKILTVNNDLSSLSMTNDARTNECGSKTCGSNITGSVNRTISTTKEPKEIMATTDMMTNTFKSLAKTSTTTNVALSLQSSTSSSAASSLSSLAPAYSTTTSSSSTSSSFLLQQQQHLLSRPKRYLSFPEGSSFSVAVCFTVGIIGNPRYTYMSFGLNWGVAYDLPNTTWILNHLHGFAKRPIPVAVWHRRSRRSLYKEIENVVDNMGYNGRDCILRALCESKQYFQKTKMGMMGEMLRVIFSLPKQRLFTRELSENSDIRLYDQAYRNAHAISDCSEQYDCDFSLLELAFGKYSTPPEGYYTKH